MLKYSKSFSGTGVRIWVEGVRHNMSWAEFDFKGNLICECTRDNFLSPGLTTEEMREAKTAIAKMRPAPYDNAYLRFNNLPEGGRIRNYATGELEAGVSCYALSWDLINQCYNRVGGGLDGAEIIYSFSKAPVYLITGEECGIGSDGEPLLTDARILASLKYDKEKGGYVEKDNITKQEMKIRDYEADKYR